MTKDYYQTLGVDKNATKEEIKRAYKRLAKKHHPDLNKKEGSTETFKEINEAFSVLGDEKKKQHYDQFGTADAQGFDQGFDFSGFGGGGFEDIFSQFFGGGGRGGRQRATGSDLLYQLEITLEEASTGIQKTIQIVKNDTCESCEGEGGKGIQTCSTCKGAGRVTQTKRSPFGIFQTTTTCPHCKGEGKDIQHPCSDCNGIGVSRQKKELEVDLPAGVDNGNRLRISGEGEAGSRNAGKGDLFVEIRIKQHPYFKRDETELILETPISFIQAAIGTTIEVPTIDGKAKLKIPPGTQTGTTFSMKNKGMPSLRGYGKGNQHVIVNIVVPKKLNKKQEESLKEFGKLIGEKVTPQKGFFDKLKESLT